MARTGRRPGRADTRGQILAAARRQFADRGYAGATIRGIAAGAGVDPALVHHYFGTKRRLFVATLELPFDPGEVVAAAVADDPQRAGERLVRALLHVWDTDAGSAMMQSFVRSAVTDDEILRMLREYLMTTALQPIVADVAPDRPDLRATLLASQIIGLGMARYVAALEPLASADHDTLVAAIGPNFQRYLTGDLDLP